MSNKNHSGDSAQLSLFDILGLAGNIDSKYSSDEIEEVIGKLRVAKRTAEKHEENERRRREKEELERKAREEREKKEAHIREVTCMDLPLDWENAFNQDVRTQGIHADSISDGLIFSLSNLGRVDIEYISSITGEDYKTIIGALKGSIYQNPETWGECFYKGWETSEEYLSGNMMRKWKAAKEADKEYDGYFADNVKAIEKVLPPTVATKDIYVTLGSPWVPTDIIDDFIEHLLGDWRRYWYSIDNEEDFNTKHDELTGTWEIPFKSRYNHDIKVTRTYGTDRINALYILERTLNMKSVAVTDEAVCKTNSSGKKRVINESETILAIEKQNKMIKAFQKWIWDDERRKERLEIIFENNFSCVRKRIFDGSFLRFPNMSPAISLYPYQKDAVARILFTPNTLLAHDVGAGKTYVMIAAAMEMRRMGLSEKNMFVVPNNIVGQWKNIFYAMYPSANILCVEPKSFTPSKRESLLERIRDEDFDGIIIAYSCFERIPLSKEYYRNRLVYEQELIAEIAGKKNKATSRLKKKQEAVSKALSELAVAMDDLYNGVYFDDLGITRLFVDEAHNFKNVPIETKADKVLGISASGSKKCKDMMDKVHMVQKKNGGAGVVFAAGNRVTDKSVAFKMPKALANRLMHIKIEGSFSSWKQWAISSGINDKVVGFLSFRQSYLMRFDSDSNDLAFPTPRAWEMVSNVLNWIDDDIDSMYYLIDGLVGTGAAVEFRTWAKVYKNLPAVEDIFDGKMPQMPKDTDVMYALTASMTAYARMHKDEMSRIANSIRYADKMPPDFSAVLLKDYMCIDKNYKEKLMTIPEFARWLQTKGWLMNGSV